MRRALLAALPLAAHAQTSATIGPRAFFLPLVVEEARRQHVPVELADAVAQIESGYVATARGSAGEVGLMQILPATAAQLGFHGPATALLAPRLNIQYATAYLAAAWRERGGSLCQALMKYRAGMGQTVLSPLSITYCARAAAWLDATGSPLISK